MYALLPAWVRDLAIDLGVIAGAVAASGVLAKSRFGRPVRWLWRTLVVVPVGHFVRDQVEHVVRDVLMAPNGGKSLADLARRFDGLDDQARQMGQRLTGLEGRLGEMHAWAKGHAEGELKTRIEDPQPEGAPP